MDGLNILSEILRHWPDKEITQEVLREDCQERLRKALCAMRERSDCVGFGDIAGLVGHVLRKEIASSGNSIELQVPNSLGWPQVSDWNEHSVKILQRLPGAFIIEARPWHSEWLESKDNIDDVFSEKIRREKDLVPADPCIPETFGDSYSNYLSQGQRSAVRSVFLAAPGTTLIVNLPTGAGKSMAAWAPALVNRQNAGLTLVIVPTVALALDQEKQINQFIETPEGLGTNPPLAWHSQLSQDDRSQIKRNIVDGKQRILFTSPESLQGSLINPLYEANARGHLKHFVVDEAHLVDQWGSDFRPEYQSMYGIRNDLLRRSPDGAQFKTVLMTATLTRETYFTLKELFGQGDDIQIVSAIHIRPEPSYWIIKALSNEHRTQKVMEIVRHCPRPFILYVTKRKDVGYWISTLTSAGVRRIEGVVGGQRDLSEILKDWKSGQIDGIVATSAFGLGMDQSNIRTVIHACIPETVDRFYQEVGRAGRDGKACASFLVYEDGDFKVSRSLSAKTSITVSIGLQRWKGMYFDADKGDELLRVDLSAKHTQVIKDTSSNFVWNLKTLILMARAGLISIEHDPPPTTTDWQSSNDEEMNEKYEKYFNSRTIKIISPYTTDEKFWNERVEPIRKQLYESGILARSLMDQVVKGVKELSEILAEVYSIPEQNVFATRACGGCEVCRKKHLNLSAYTPPTSEPIKCLDTKIDPYLKKVLGVEANNFGLVSYHYESYIDHPKRLEKLLMRFMEQSVTFGVTEIAASNEWLSRPGYRELYKRSPKNMVIHSDLEQDHMIFDQPYVPRVTVIDSQRKIEAIPVSLFTISRPLHIIVFPTTMTNDCPPYKKLTDIFNHISLEMVLERFSL